MRLRVVALAMAAALVGLGTVPARAQNPYHYEVDFGRAAFAVWEEPRTESFGFAFVAQGVVYNSDLGGQPMVGEIGCASVSNATTSTFGCGPLSSFSINDDLGAARGKGTFDALTFDPKTGNNIRRGKISIDLAWTATGDSRPHGDGGYFVDGTDVGFGTGPAIAREAHKVKGRILRSPLGRGPSRLVDGQIIVGSSISLDFGG